MDLFRSRGPFLLVLERFWAMWSVGPRLAESAPPPRRVRFRASIPSKGVRLGTWPFGRPRLRHRAMPSNLRCRPCNDQGFDRSWGQVQQLSRNVHHFDAGSPYPISSRNLPILAQNRSGTYSLAQGRSDELGCQIRLVSRAHDQRSSNGSSGSRGAMAPREPPRSAKRSAPFIAPTCIFAAQAAQVVSSNSLPSDPGVNIVA